LLFTETKLGVLTNVGAAFTFGFEEESVSPFVDCNLFALRDDEESDLEFLK
jgi:hypothetical protein